MMVLLSGLTVVWGNVVRVPQDYPTIQQGINAALNGDTVLVDPGTYVENINFNGKAILVASNYIIAGDSTAIAGTIIDGGATGRVVSFTSGEDSTSRIVGFTLRNGSGYNGGGVYCSGSSPSLSHLVIQGNSAGWGGGGIACQYSANPIITDCKLSANTALYGGGIWTDGSQPVIGSPTNRCNIYNNVSTNEYGLGSELYLLVAPGLTVYLDTFTVLYPDEELVYPINSFILDINTPYFSPITVDTYVSPTGDNANDGLSPATPFRNIWYAALRTVSTHADSLTINILPGTYSPALTGERTVHPKSHVSLAGEDSGTTILDGGGKLSLVYLHRDSSITISGLAIRNGNASLGAGIYCEDSKATITKNLIIGNGNSLGGTGSGGGIYCTGDASPTIKGNRIASNFSFGISCSFNSRANIIDNIIIGNLGGSGNIVCSDASDALIADNVISGDSISYGSGISCDRNSNPTIVGNVIKNNHFSNGAGISCNNNSNPYIYGNTIAFNIASSTGGGIYCSSSNPNIDSNVIMNNAALGFSGAFGGGIFCMNSSATITRNEFIGNSALGNPENVVANAGGGGICTENSLPVIGGSAGNGNQFEGNVALRGADLYRKEGSSVVNAKFNTFDIYPLSAYYARPAGAFDVSNGVGRATPIVRDVYVAPWGSNLNDGLTGLTPFLNLRHALSRILPSPTVPLTVRIAAGTYSPSATGEVFPLPMLSHVSLSGTGPDSTILDAESSNRVIYCFEVDSLTISGLRIQGGKAASGGGIYCDKSHPIIHYNMITLDSADWGSAIYCTRGSKAVISNNTVTQNATIGYPYWYKFGAVFIDDTSRPLLLNNVITYNRSQNGGAGISCNGSSPSIINNTIFGNEAGDQGGGILCWNNSSPTIQSNIIWGNLAPVDTSITVFSSSPIVTFSDVQGGWSGAGNINADPLFADSTRFLLTSGSPCIDAADPSLPLDSDGTRADMGAWTFFHFPPNLLAYYPLHSHWNDNTVRHGPMVLTNTLYQEGGIYCNGIYVLDPSGTGCQAITPSLYDFDFNSFTIDVAFKVDEYPTITERPVFIGGGAYRWAGFILQTDSTVLFRYNNNFDQPSTLHYSLNTWHEATITYDGSVGNLYLDTKLACSVQFTIDHGNDRNVGITNFANATTFKGWIRDFRIYSSVVVPTGVREQKSPVPLTFRLEQNYPNPFNPVTHIQFQIPTSSHVTLMVYDILGREVATPVNEQLNAGRYETTFDGSRLASGVYFYRVRAGNFVQTRKLLLQK